MHYFLLSQELPGECAYDRLVRSGHIAVMENVIQTLKITVAFGLLRKPKGQATIAALIDEGGPMPAFEKLSTHSNPLVIELFRMSNQIAHISLNSSFVMRECRRYYK